MRPAVPSLIALLLSASPALPQATSQAPAMTSDQQSQFDAARKDFSAEHWADALTKFDTLHAQLPADNTITKYEAEAATNTGDLPRAIALIKPIRDANPSDVQAIAILAHAYAQARQSAERDAQLAQLQTLHDAGNRTPQSIILERDPLPKGGYVTFHYFLEPYSRFKIYVMAYLFDANGKQLQRITLESSDFDQPLFVEQHPKEAAAGQRLFSMDGYINQTAANGTAAQTHATYGFFNGRPSFDTVRDKILAIADGKAGPVSTTSGIPTPKPSN